MVAVDDLALLIHTQAAISISVVRDADVRAIREHRLLQRFKMRRAASFVDVDAVRLCMDHMHVGAQAAQDARHAVVRRTIRTVEHDLQAVELHACRALHEVDVFAHILLAALDAANVLARRTRQLLARLDAAHETLDLILHSIGQLVAVAAEEFDAVVIEGVVRR